MPIPAAFPSVLFHMKSLRNARFLAGLFVLAGLAAALSGCSGPYSYGGMGYNNNGGGTGNTISGTITLTNLSATGYAYVTAAMASYPYSTSVSEPPVSATQTLSYSVANLPSGTYSVTVAITTTKASPTSGSCTYTVDAGSPVADLPAVTGAYTWTMTVSSLPVNANVQLDAAMN